MENNFDKLKKKIFHYELHYLLFIGFFTMILVSTGGRELADLVGWVSNVEVIVLRNEVSHARMNTGYYFNLNGEDRTYFFMSVIIVLTFIFSVIFYSCLIVYKLINERKNLIIQNWIVWLMMIALLLGLKLDRSYTFLNLIT